MADYDKMSAERIQNEKDAVDDKDEDGWTTVTKKYNFICFSQIIIKKLCF